MTTAKILLERRRIKLWQRLKSNSVLIGLGVALLFFIWYNNRPSADHDKNNLITDRPDDIETIVGIDETAQEPVVEEVIVDIKGAVKNPGVYEVDPQARVNEVVEKAGGFTEKAAEQLVNLAEIVYDEMYIVIPTIEDDETIDQTVATNDGKAKVHINRADQAELETLNGIGPSKAEAIINYRDEHGPFKTVDDLLNVSGIGEKTLEIFRDEIQIP